MSAQGHASQLVEIERDDTNTSPRTVFNHASALLRVGNTSGVFAGPDKADYLKQAQTCPSGFTQLVLMKKEPSAPPARDSIAATHAARKSQRECR